MEHPRKNKFEKPPATICKSPTECSKEKTGLRAQKVGQQHMNQIVRNTGAKEINKDDRCFNSEIQLEKQSEDLRSYNWVCAETIKAKDSYQSEIRPLAFSQNQQANQLEVNKQNPSEQTAWPDAKDDQLRNRIINDCIYDWMTLSNEFETGVNKIKIRWQFCIYPHLLSNYRIAGSRKWTLAEDSILTGAELYFRTKMHENNAWEKILQFLPERSVESIYGRFRRLQKKLLKKNQFLKFKEQSKHKTEAWFLGLYQYRKYIIRKIGQKKQSTSNLKSPLALAAKKNQRCKSDIIQNDQY